MITLLYPQSNENFYLSDGGAVFGPFASDGTFAPTKIEFRSDKDRISEVPSALDEHFMNEYHEKFVDHVQVAGELTYSPMMEDYRFTPDAKYPARCSVYTKSYNGQTSTIAALYGLISTESSSIVRNSTATYSSMHYALSGSRKGNKALFTIWYFGCALGAPKSLVFLQKREITKVTPYGGDDYYLTIQEANYDCGGAGLRTDIDWAATVPLGLIETFSVPGRSWRYKPEYKIIRSMYAPRNAVVRSPGSLLKLVNASIDTRTLDYFPVSEVHFGDLASRAVKSMNAINRNMIEFIKDARHPKRLIPQLRNMRNLQGMAGTYLSVQFGILPTASDLKALIGAFRARIPYLDSNGFTSVNASHIASQSTGKTSYTLEQRIKVAIDVEDSYLDALCQGLDNYGILPNFENIWDLVRYSFVIDWLINVGDFLERIDDRHRLERYNIRYATMSTKKVVTRIFSDPTIPFVGQFNTVHYHRWTTDHCPVPPLSLQLPEAVTSHWLEATALVIQRAK